MKIIIGATATGKTIMGIFEKAEPESKDLFTVVFITRICYFNDSSYVRGK